LSQDINSVVIVGRLTRDAQLSYTPSGSAVCKFSIANNQRRKKGEEWVDEAGFFDVILWAKTAEALAQYLLKGKQVIVAGKLTQNRWEQEGAQRSKVEIVALNVELLGGGKPQEGTTRQEEHGENEDGIAF
jgi:single-strand DNA-binding protein